MLQLDICVSTDQKAARICLGLESPRMWDSYVERRVPLGGLAIKWSWSRSPPGPWTWSHRHHICSRRILSSPNPWTYPFFARHFSKSSLPPHNTYFPVQPHVSRPNLPYAWKLLYPTYRNRTIRMCTYYSVYTHCLLSAHKHWPLIRLPLLAFVIYPWPQVSDIRCIAKIKRDQDTRLSTDEIHWVQLAFVGAIFKHLGKRVTFGQHGRWNVLWPRDDVKLATFLVMT